jgi:hypothetical protein
LIARVFAFTTRHVSTTKLTLAWPSRKGPQAQWLHDLTVPHAERVIVCNVRGRSETTNKSDGIDADGLSELLRLGALKPVFHGAPEDNDREDCAGTLHVPTAPNV